MVGARTLIAKTMNQEKIKATDLKTPRPRGDSAGVDLKSFLFALNALVPAHYSFNG